MRAAGLAAAGAWVLFCVRWFDVAAPWRPAWMAALPPWLLALALAVAMAPLVRRHGQALVALPAGASAREMSLAVALAVFFRVPIAWSAAIGYTTPDGSLSGIVAWRLREGIEHLVFVPGVPYSGSLKSHLAAALGLAIDLSRAFTLSSVVFYGIFVAAVYGLAAAVNPRVARLGALWAVFAPAFITRYSLSNDGNYVEVLALGTLALLMGVRAGAAEPPTRDVLAWAAGLGLGLAFWSHILAVIPALATGLLFAHASLRTLPRLAAGFVLGALPSLLWNAANGGESFRYLLPGGQSVGTLESGPSLGSRIAGIATDHWPVLMGYDPGYGTLVDSLMWGGAGLGMLAAACAYAVAIARFRRDRDRGRGALLLLSAVNVGVAALALPYIEGNPRYLLFLTGPLAILLADAFGRGPRVWGLGLLIVFALLGSIGQWPPARHADERWRAFVDGLIRIGVRHCHTDFYLAAKINLVSEERVVCAADLGPTTTEYFKDYPARAAAAPQAALIAVNPTAADKLERRLQRIGVPYRRLDLMKPVLLPDRNVHPSELFPPTDSTHRH